MFENDLIDKKIEVILNQKGKYIDETREEDMILYLELRDFAEKHKGLLYQFNNEFYLVINFIDTSEFLIIPVEYKI